VNAIDIIEEGEGVTHITFEDAHYDRAIPDEQFEPPH
jgi:hypothetical protein